MRKFSVRSLITLAAMTTAMLAAATPLRSQTKPSTAPSTTQSVEISRPVKPESTSSKKTSVVKMFEDISISPNFTPKEIELRGISGGGVETQKKSGRKVTETGDCIGFIDTEPDHKITLTKPFQYLKMQVKSSGDTILLVRGPGGIWCSDDVSDRNPEISGDWLEGTYEVWIGSYEENTSFPYLLQLTEKPQSTK
ncbi:MAG: hypothetical protein DCF20_06780 [Pseudanabaena sp.]|nr:MAG: hypothetical protein DCF20_06780 [Pseudanabaena sp.]